MYKPKLSTQFLLILSSLLFFASCSNNRTPKPNAYLALNYPEAEYTSYKNSFHNFTFDLNKQATVKEIKSTAFEVHYPAMKATVFLNFKTVTNDNLDGLLKDAQKLTYEHFIKADEIIEQPYVNDNDKVFGMFYNVKGNAATNIQFYATDSTKNFLTASLYFYTQPNFDSILPATHYIQEDMRQMLESLKWDKK